MPKVEPVFFEPDTKRHLSFLHSSRWGAKGKKGSYTSYFLALQLSCSSVISTWWDVALRPLQPAGSTGGPGGGARPAGCQQDQHHHQDHQSPTQCIVGRDDDILFLRAWWCKLLTLASSSKWAGSRPRLPCRVTPRSDLELSHLLSFFISPPPPRENIIQQYFQHLQRPIQ